MRLILRWSSGLPSASSTRACGSREAAARGRDRSGRDRRPWPPPSSPFCDRPGAAPCGRSARSCRRRAAGAEDAEQAALLARQPLDRLGLEAEAVDIASVSRVMRARTRSPMPIGSPSVAAAFAMAGTTDRGRAPSSLSQTAACAMRSPSSSRPMISSTATGGRLPFSRKSLRLPASVPSSAISASSRFKAMRSPPLMPKARAISRLPTLPGDVPDELEDLLLRRQAAVCGLRGVQRSFGLRGHASAVPCRFVRLGVPSWRQLLAAAAFAAWLRLRLWRSFRLRTSPASPGFARPWPFGFGRLALRAGFLPPPLAIALGEERDRLVDRQRRRVLSPSARWR